MGNAAQGQKGVLYFCPNALKGFPGHPNVASPERRHVAKSSRLLRTAILGRFEEMGKMKLLKIPTKATTGGTGGGIRPPPFFPREASCPKWGESCKSIAEMHLAISPGVRSRRRSRATRKLASSRHGEKLRGGFVSNSRLGELVVGGRGGGAVIFDPRRFYVQIK